MVELLFQGGRTMLPLFLCSLISLTIIIERFFALRKVRVVPRAVVENIEEGENVQSIVDAAREKKSSLSNIIIGLEAGSDVSSERRTIMYSTLFKKEVNALERGLIALEVIAAISPLLGLLGTVLGMVDVFNVVAEVGVGQASALSSGIAKALITTIAGLSIAIPTLVFHSFFMKKTESLALELEEISQNFYHRLS
jgi:biopolymer transport protein ExbB